MASRPVSPQYLKAGEEYVAAARGLGLRPGFAGWGWEISTSQWLLVLVTSIVDAGGPLALNRLLFRAYNAKATPRAISPFIVRVFSPEIIPDDFYMIGSKNLTITGVKKSSREVVKGVKVENMQRTLFGIEFELVNSFYSDFRANKKNGYHEARSEWQRFKRNVEKLAA
jgi:hypothetical protein